MRVLFLLGPPLGVVPSRLRSAPSSWRLLRVGTRVAESEPLFELDVVTYTRPLLAGEAFGRVGVAAVVKVRDGRVHLCPLRYESGSGLWLEQEGAGELQLPAEQLERLTSDFAQRAVQDRVSNPHGEHAENTWLLEEVPEALRRDNEL